MYTALHVYLIFRTPSFRRLRLHFALCAPKCVFDAPQDLRPLYAGRCDYHSSETAADRDVRRTPLHFTLELSEATL